MRMCNNWYVIIVLHHLKQCKRGLFLLIQRLTLIKNRSSHRHISGAGTESSLFFVYPLCGLEIETAFPEDFVFGLRLLATQLYKNSNIAAQWPCSLLLMCCSPLLLHPVSTATAWCSLCCLLILPLIEAAATAQSRRGCLPTLLLQICHPPMRWVLI